MGAKMQNSTCMREILAILQVSQCTWLRDHGQVGLAWDRTRLTDGWMGGRIDKRKAGRTTDGYGHTLVNYGVPGLTLAGRPPASHKA